MCEYCENNNAITNIVHRKDHIATFCMEIKNDIAKTSSIIQTSVEIIPPIYYENRINYCPMCGRKLAEDKKNE